MIKNILAFFGFLFLSLVILLGVGTLGLFYDTVGLLSVPKNILQQILPEEPVLPKAVTVSVADGGMMKAEWSNPLDLLPEASPTPLATATPLPTATPVPPLDPSVYRAETLVRLKDFVRALEGWLEINDRAAVEPNLVDDAAWQNEMTSSLAVVVERSDALASIGPPPAEYTGMDALFDRVQEESQSMQRNIEQGFSSRDPAQWTAAGDSFARVKEYLSQAVVLMVEAGWSLE